jgi:hypothetical protein
MSATALAMVLMHFALVGITHEADEGTLAHLFQLLMVVQLPFIAYDVLVQFPRTPARSLKVLLMQLATACAALVAARMLT